MRYGRKRRDDPGQTQQTTVTQDDAPRELANAAAAPEAPGPSTSEVSEIPPSLHARFEAFEFLGRGGMGTVYRARDLRLGREVAIKLLFGAEHEALGSVLREARSQARIKHENVCEVYEAGTADHVRFIVMQLIHGEPLDKVKSAMSLEEKVRVVRLVASALHEAHRLGLVHRDVKPANIMVERGEDGAFKPYIMDFGLAREMGDSGATVSGALMGTPSFMAPEQAAGKVRSLDRRTDVYCLGATLYDLLVGRPPSVAESLSALLHAIMHEEPLSPRQIEGSLPLDLDAIVMKCLEKQPAARYESAKALGDDLQRFLDGEPVSALARARLYALVRRAKRHKVKLSITSVVLVVAAVFVGGWMSERARAAKQAELARELGENVKEMEFFLRNAHGLPLHDIDRERRIVREKLRAIASVIEAAGDIGVGPGHYALGRGYLALQEPAEALGHLRQAQAAGYRAAGLDDALGMALSEMYKRELADTKRMEGEGKKQRIAAIEAEYKAPALVHLRAALGGTIEAPAYAEGLIALYEGRHDEALVKAREAFEKAPWLYEAKKLEGDVLFAMGSKFGHDAAFDFAQMSRSFGQADVAYRAAAEIGSSDPAVHLSMCELYTQRMNGERAAGKAIRSSFEDAKGACGKANAASSTSGLGALRLAQVFAHFAWHVAGGDLPNESPEVALTEAIERVGEAIRRNPVDPMAHYLLGSLWRSRAIYASDRGLDVAPPISAAIAAYEEALRLDPVFVWAQNELCSSLAIRGRYEARRGVEPTATLGDAIARCERAKAVEPTFFYPTTNTIYARSIAAEYAVAAARAPEEEIRAALSVIDASLRENPGHAGLIYWATTLHRLAAVHALQSKADPGPALERAEASVREYEQKQPGSIVAHQLRGQVASTRARWLLEQGRDPAVPLREARDSFDRTVKAKPWDLDYRVWSAEVEITAARWALRAGKGDAEPLDRARALLSPLLDVERADPSLYAVLGEIHELRAMSRIERGAEATREVDEGLSWIEKALAKNPRMPVAIACKGRLAKLREGQADEGAGAARGP